jgi:uncharacterized membrane protein HdeD (DUF308 family)
MDLRTPSGWFFVLLGVILVALGVLSPETRAPLTDANVNLYSGIAMLIFGLLMLGLAYRASKAEK